MLEKKPYPVRELMAELFSITGKVFPGSTKDRITAGSSFFLNNA
jgi:hypothetical protein